MGPPVAAAGKGRVLDFTVTLPSSTSIRTAATPGSCPATSVAWIDPVGDGSPGPFPAPSPSQAPRPRTHTNTPNNPRRKVIGTPPRSKAVWPPAPHAHGANPATPRERLMKNGHAERQTRDNDAVARKAAWPIVIHPR